VTGLQLIFATRSGTEARVVRGLLEAHGIQAFVSSDVPHMVFPAGEVRLSVHADEAQLATELIESHRRQPVDGPTVVSFREEFRDLERRIGYRFRDHGLVEHALTHRSRAHEDITGGVVDNESMEFLGDAVLGFVIADHLYREYPALDEGEKSKLKATVVSTTTLARVATELDLGSDMLLGRGEEKTGGRRKQALLADTLEALIAAIYLDGGVDAAREFVLRALAPLMAENQQARGAYGPSGDFKSALQEALQSRGDALPEYRTVAETGPDHDKVFRVELVVGGDVLAAAEGRSKKEAEQQAARAALDQLVNRSR
jgi:ribonuclease-3